MEVLGEAVFRGDAAMEQEVWRACLAVNEVNHSQRSSQGLRIGHDLRDGMRPRIAYHLYERCSKVQGCLQALLHRAVTGKPLGILKYAMTLDGKIATSTGHSAWVTCPASRSRVLRRGRAQMQ